VHQKRAVSFRRKRLFWTKSKDKANFHLFTGHDGGFPQENSPVLTGTPVKDKVFLFTELSAKKDILGLGGTSKPKIYYNF